MKRLFVFCALLIPLMTSAQFVKHQDQSPRQVTADVGIGLGIDYGGIGARVSVFPEKHVGLFGAVGYALSGTGYNFGLKFRANPEKRYVFVAGAMYGYNGVIKVNGAPQYDKIYYGPSLFAGVEFHGRSIKNFSTVELVLPFRSTAFTNDLNALQANPAIRMPSVSPVAFSIAYHFGL